MKKAEEGGGEEMDMEMEMEGQVRSAALKVREGKVARIEFVVVAVHGRRARSRVGADDRGRH
jgi:hypothetical protein